jgi:hypothetical protein
MLGVWFLLQRGQLHLLLTKYASASLSTSIFGVRRTLGHPSTRPVMGDGGAEQGVVFAPPGFQHQQQSSTDGLAHQQVQHATKGEKCS